MSKYKRGDRVRVVSVPEDGDWPMQVGNTGSVAEDQDDGLPYVRVDLDMRRKGALLLSCEIERVESTPPTETHQ